MIGGEGDYWNGVYADVFGRPLKIVRPWQTLAADGATLTGVTVNCSGFLSADHWPQAAGAPVDHPLMNSYLEVAASAGLLSSVFASGKNDTPAPAQLPEKDRWKEKFELREVETGLASFEKIEIAKGLKPGDEVAVEDPTRPKEKKDRE